MEDFIRAAQGVCYGSTNAERSAAEAQLSVIIEQEGALAAFLDGLYTAEDTVFFFICLGLQRILWKRWGQLEQQQQTRVTHILSQCLTERGAGTGSHSSAPALQVFSRRKLEQVMSCACAQLGSLDPVVAVLQALSVSASGEEGGGDAAAETRRLISSLSLLRTVLEETLNLGDPRLTPQQQEAAQAAAAGMVVPATSLACSTIQRYMSQLGAADPSTRQKHLALISLSIDTLKVILAKIPIGPHLTADMLHLLFALAQLGAGSDDQLIPVANSALEGLQELMAKRFVPAEGLVLLADKAGLLLREFRGACSASSSPLCLPALLDFVCSFAVTHVARCMQLPGGQATVFQLVQEMVAICTQCKEPEVLVKLTAVWQELLEVETISGYVVGDPDAPQRAKMDAGEKLMLVKHFLFASLCTRNESLAEDYLQDMIEGCPVGQGGASAAIVDLRLRKIAEVGQSGLGGAGSGGAVGLHGGGGGGAVEGAEEESNPGSALVQQVQQFLAAMSACPVVRQMLAETLVSEMGALLGLQQQQGQGQERRQAAIMDLAHLARVLTCCLEPAQAMLSIISLLTAQAQAQAQMVTYSLETSHLWVTLCHVLGQMSHYVASLPADQRRHAVLQTLPQLLQITQQGCDSRLSPPPAAVTNSTLALLLQWLSSAWIELGAAQGQDQQWDVLVAESLGVVRGLWGSTTGPEAHSLLACCCDVLDHGATAQAASTALRAACDILRSAQTVGPVQAVLSLKAGGNFFGVKRSLVSLTAILTHHGSSSNTSVSSANSTPRRQLVASIGEDLHGVLSELTTLLFQLASIPASTYDCDELQKSSSGLSRGGKRDSGGTMAQIVSVTPVAINLSCAMLQTLGRTAVHGAVSVFRSGVHFLNDDGSGNGAGVGAPMLLEVSATMTLLARQMLKLLLALAEGGASRGAGGAALQLDNLSLRLLTCMSTALGTDARLVAELLQDVLLAGTGAARTFWCNPSALKNQLAAPGSANGNTGTDNGSGSSSGGTNDSARSIVQLLCSIIAASMGAAVPPQDALVATEGALAVVDSLGLLRTPWFFSSGVWSTLVTAVLRALVCRHHQLHHVHIESLLFSQLVLPLTNQQKLQSLQESAQRLGEAQLLPLELQAGPDVRGVLALCFNCLMGIAEESGCGSGAQTALSRVASAAGNAGTEAAAETLLRAAITAVSAEVAKATIRDT